MVFFGDGCTLFTPLRKRESWSCDVLWPVDKETGLPPTQDDLHLLAAGTNEQHDSTSVHVSIYDDLYTLKKILSDKTTSAVNRTTGKPIIDYPKLAELFVSLYQ